MLSGRPRMTKRQRYILSIGLALFGVFAALCVANRPRFWWQDRFCDAAMYWVPISLVSLIWLTARWRKARSVLLIIGVLCHGYAVAFMDHKAWPFLFFSRWPEATVIGQPLVSGIWIDSWGESDRSEPVAALVAQRKPDLLLVSGYGTDRLIDRLAVAGLTNRVRVRNPLDGEIQLATRFDTVGDSFKELGIGALPGGSIRLRLPDRSELLLGTMALTRSISKESFQRNRITSRRLSSIMRNSSESRLVVANFGTSPFSQLAAIYPEQTRMRSLMFGGGLLKTFDYRRWWSHFTYSNVFISKDLTRVGFERITLPERGSALLYFSVARARGY
jgi:hypothetical protein